MGLLDGKVVIITGAGGGIGRAHALACAVEGARVVVNDLGGDRDGAGRGRAADRVVAEIVAAGGVGIADHGSVTEPTDCAAMVACALDAWGRVDVIVNNAGILRDKTFAKMTAQEWHPVVDVHLHGTRNLCAAALPALSKQGGAIINTTSYSGMIGNYGQSNYAAAKAGVYGLTRVLALELRKAGITVNAIAPVAKTRMTQDIAMVDDAWSADQISPMVLYLASDLAKAVTGQVFGVQGQRLHLYEVKVNDGVEKPGDAVWTAPEIHAAMDRITAWEAPSADVAPETDDQLTRAFSFFPTGYKPTAVPDWRAVVQWRVTGGTDQTITVSDGVCSVNPGLTGTPTCTVKVSAANLLAILTGDLDGTQAFMTGKAVADNMSDLMSLAMAFDFRKAAAAYKAAGDTPAAPTPVVASAPAAPAPGPVSYPIGKSFDGGYLFVDAAEGQAYARATDDPNPRYFTDDGVVPPMLHVKAIVPLMVKMCTDPDLNLDLLRLVHAEHDVTFHRLLHHGDVFSARGRLASVEEKSSGLLVTFEIFGFVDGQTALEGVTKVFIRGERKATAPSKASPKAAPDAPPAPDLTLTQPVTPDQATRYAVASGDDNPIHVSPETARAAGLPGVILHGLCAMAFAQRDLINTYADGDPGRLARLAVRFAKPVFPGETLAMHVWRGPDDLHFTTKNAQGKATLSNGIARIR